VSMPHPSTGVPNPRLGAVRAAVGLVRWLVPLAPHGVVDGSYEALSPWVGAFARAFVDPKP
jgi:hypothetical protein